MTLAEYLNSQFSAMQELDFFLRILTACLCGGCIGLESPCPPPARRGDGAPNRRYENFIEF